ncbi:ATP-binding cassette domain-containing protein [Dactylosporangium sp. NPDC049140]|uniref:ATP-binding cassette domain-containing protein n=1 Tax=Dactylosporangium sp. NPDC049140 TaxID=3155647 RepID=UPI0033D6B1F0
MSTVLSVDGVHKVFGAHHVLRGVSLDVAEHEVVALIGASGSGKSTLLRCVNLLEPVDDGTIRLDGLDVTDPRTDPDRVRRHIGMVFQAFNVFPHMTVLGQRDSRPAPRAPRRGRRGLGAGDGAAGPHRPGRPLLALLAPGAYPDRLSGGQQQRVAIVRP